MEVTFEVWLDALWGALLAWWHRYVWFCMCYL